MALTETMLGEGFGGAIAGFILAFLFIFVIIMIGLYIYISLAFTAMGKKAKLKSPELAWIPFIGPNITKYQASKMHWWPWLLFIGMIIPIVNIFAWILFLVFATVWQWKLFEKIRKPGWWSVICLIPVVNLVFWGIAAWSD